MLKKWICSIHAGINAVHEYQYFSCIYIYSRLCTVATWCLPTVCKLAAHATYSHTHILAGATLASFPDHERGENRPGTRLQPRNLSVLVLERCTVQLILNSVVWGLPNINWPLLYTIIPTLFAYLLVCHPYISFHSKVLLFYLGSHAVGSNCDHMHQADQFHTASNLVVDLGTIAEPAHI